MSQGQRRLAAIMVTDMVGYTSMAQKDEARAVELLEEHRGMLRPIFRKHGGKEIGTIGDAFLVEFTSALDAVRCSLEIQSFLQDQNKRRSDERKIVLRIGIHLGDVIHKGKDISGDAVNVASRIEPLAPPGGVCLTAQVYYSVMNKVECTFESLGTPHLKNVMTSVEVYRISGLGDVARSPAVETPGLPKNRIAVLPFVNMSAASDDEFFADGLTEEIIGRVSRVKGLDVIARTSVMNYKGKEKGVRQIGTELRVGAVLEGSVRRSGNRIRASAQLIDCNTEGHLWSSSYDRNLEDAFEVQASIAENVASALELSLKDKRSPEPTTSISREAYLEHLRGLYFWHRFDEKSFRNAILHFEKALELAPNYAEAMAGVSTSYAGLGYFLFEPRDRAYQKAKEYALKAIQIDDTIPEAHLSLGVVYFFQDGNWTLSRLEFERALELNPNYVDAHIFYAVCYLLSFGHKDEAVAHARRILDLDPLSPFSEHQAANIYCQAGRYAEALTHIDRALEMEPDSAAAHNDRAIVLMSSGRKDEGVKEFERALQLSSGSWFFKGNLGYAYAVTGKKEEALRILAELEAVPKELGRSVMTAEVYQGLGEYGRALDWLERAYDEHMIIFSPLISVEEPTSPRWKEPRFVALVKRLGLNPPPA